MTLSLESGRVVAVTIRNAGDELAHDHAAGVIAFDLTDAGPFSEAGGRLLIAGDTLTYTGYVDLEDDDNDTIQLAAPTANSYDAGTKVTLLPETPVMTAQVELSSIGAAVPAIVWHTLYGYLSADGIRDPEDQESGIVLTDGDDYWLVDVLGKKPALDPTVIAGGGGGGGDIDGGNDDDTFVLPTISEYVFDGYPEFYVDADTGRIYTEDEAYDLDDAFIIYVELASGSFTYDTEKMDHDYAQVLYPAWSVPLLGQDEKITIDSATASGLSSGVLDSVAGGGVGFGYMYDSPDSTPSFSMTNHFILHAEWYSGAQHYHDRTWFDANGNGDFPMPSSSEAETFPIDGDLHTRGMIVITPQYWSSGGVDTPHTSIAMTGIRMEQA